MSPEDPRTSSLSPGTRLGPYEITGSIGAGGMGEVYRATDTKLQRTVAVKVLPGAFTEDRERLARFEREAQMLAQLHHPNIASIFGLEESEGTLALVLELVEGPTLAERLDAGRLPLEDSVGIALQMARALEQAHERGIIHRDLKPQNVKAPMGADVKVLDFGLAKALEAGTGSAPRADLSLSPTVLASPGLTAGGATQAGTILGTAAYMSPEQAKGQPVDQRGDIWAFGVILYEMLTGASPFARDSVAETLAAVLNAEVDLSKLPSGTPPEIVRLLRRCLERDPRNRLHHIADARIALQDVAAGTDDVERPALAALESPSSMNRLIPWIVAAAALAVAVAVWLGVGNPGGETLPTPAPPLTLGVPVPADTYLPGSEWPLVDLSADGRTMVVLAGDDRGQAIYRRSLDRLDFTRVEGSAGAVSPILSPDGRDLAFVRDGWLHKLPIEGGVAVRLAATQAQRGASWTSDGSIIFSPLYSSGLWRVPSTGGEPEPVTTLDPAQRERTHRWPHVLPDGNTVLFTVGWLDNTSDYDVGAIDAVRLDSGERRTVLEGARMARYSAGYLVFQRRQSLLAVRFDAERLETLGEPFLVREGVGGDTGSGSGYFAVSAGGTIVLAPETAIPTERVLALVNRQGSETELPLEPASFVAPRFSPDGDRLAFVIGDGQLSADDDVYLYDLESGRRQRLTFSQHRGFPTWSPDGRQVVFTIGTSGNQGLGIRAADGSGTETRIPLVDESEYFLVPDAWLPDDRLIVTDVQRSLDVLMVDVDTGAVTPLAADPEDSEWSASVSPDGRFLAYTSTESGSNEVFVETLPRGEGKWLVSAEGGSCPTWSGDGRHLYFASGSAMMGVEVELGGVFRSGPPRELFSGPYRYCPPGRREYDVSADDRFVVVKRKLLSSVPRQMVLMQGWQSTDPAAAERR